MSATTRVFCTASSSIHADLVVLGLKRVGMPTNSVSMIYPGCYQPYTVHYWLAGALRRTLSGTGETVIISGPLRFEMKVGTMETDEYPSLLRSFRGLGLSEAESRRFGAALLEDRVVVAVEATDDAQVALILHMLHHLGAESIATVEYEKVPDRAYTQNNSWAGTLSPAA